ncbi:MAG: 50S ribosomal protein L25/general stress protein Ctc [Deltaproteobacteria bacterium]|nr:MAG: 50S ribosomal protein L25/general stress protein Ctc [Deltaproteobacteria bacterium]
MAEYAFDVTKREKTGKEVAKKLRRQGMVPAIIYGRGKTPVPISVERRSIEKYLREVSGTTLIRLRVNGSDEIFAIVKDYQLDPVKDEVIHVDFQEVDLTQKTTVEVPIVIVGKAKGVERGGLMEVVTREIEVECLPTQIPEKIEVDVTDLDIGAVVHVEDLQFPEGVEPAVDPDLTILTIYEPAEEEEAVAEEEAEEAAEEAGAPSEEE